MRVIALFSILALGSCQEHDSVSLLQTSVVKAHNFGTATAECKAARATLREKKKKQKELKAALKAAKAALKAARGETGTAKDAVAEACPVKEKGPSDEDLKNLGYIQTKGVSCGWLGGCNGMTNQLSINKGSRSMATNAGDVSTCEELCNEHDECDGFCLVGHECYFRKDTECNDMVPTAGRSCWQKPKNGRECATGQFQNGEECSAAVTPATSKAPVLGEGLKGKGIWGGTNCGHMDREEIPYSTACTRFVLCEDKPSCTAKGISSPQTCMDVVAKEDGCEKDFFEWRSYNSHCFCNPKGRTWVPSTVHAPSVTYPMK
jgi:hypothetical protein